MHEAEETFKNKNDEINKQEIELREYKNKEEKLQRELSKSKQTVVQESAKNERVSNQNNELKNQNKMSSKCVDDLKNDSDYFRTKFKGDNVLIESIKKETE
jgi:hypothetical protein